MENLKEFARLTSLYRKNAKLFDFFIGAIAEEKFHIGEDIILSGFPKDEIESSERDGSRSYPYELSVTIEGVVFYAIVSDEQFKREFPDRIESEIDKLEKKLSELKGDATQ